MHLLYIFFILICSGFYIFINYIFFHLGCGGNELDAPGGAHEDLSQAAGHRRVDDVRGGGEADTQWRVCLVSI